MLRDFISAIRGGICGVMRDRYVISNGIGETSVKLVPGWSKSHSQSQSHSRGHSRRRIWYIDANNFMVLH